MIKRKYKNVIFIIADTVRTKNIGIYGKKPSPTPNIDNFSVESSVFTNAYSSITKTDPSITSIMTGIYPESLGLVNHAQNVSELEENYIQTSKSLAQILSEAGFKTAAVDWLGRWHLRGFDYYSGKIEDDDLISDFSFTSNLFLHYLRLLGKASVKITHRDYFMRGYYAFSKNSSLPYDPANLVVDKGIEIIQKNKKKKLFLYLHFWDAHEPHTKVGDFKSYLFDDVETSYEKELSFLDNELGRLFKYLKRTGQYDDSLIIFTADHGENFYEFGSPFNHDFLYDPVVKVPLIIKGGSPKFIDTPFRHIDIVPTILKILNVKVPENIDGKPFSIKSSNDIFFEDIIRDRKIKFLGNNRKLGIKVGNYKYIRTLKGDRDVVGRIAPSENLKIISEEIYNLEKDPGEKRNILRTNKKIHQKLKNRLDELIMDFNMGRLLRNKNLSKKVQKSINVIKKAFKKYPKDKIAIAWTGGKDSTVLLHMVRLAFDGKIPCKVIFNDSTMEFDEIYEFIDRVKKLWNIDLITIKHSRKELNEFYSINNPERKKELSRLMKITAINSVVKKYKLKALIAGIRWDEHESRAKEKYFSKRSSHDRVHPILHLTENDIWEYIHHFGVPYVDLYNKGYRSLGEKPFTKKAKEGEGERSGREKDKEKLMENLRKLGYW